MRFGEFIQDQRVAGWEGNYVDYNILKKQLEMLTAQPPRLRSQGEHQFKMAVDHQLEIVNNFFAKKLQSLQQALDPAMAKPTNPTKQGWVETADKQSILIAQLEQFAFLNYEGFRKILKKHDKNCQVPMLSAFMIELEHREESFWKLSRKLRQCVDGVVALYARGGRYENLQVEPLESAVSNESNDFSEAGVKKAFIRKNHKYWIPRHRVYELMSRLAAYLPLYYFGEGGVDPLTTSVYLDNDNMDMYARRLRREDGATLIRMRVYGDNHPSNDGVCFVERKTHCEAIYGGTSKKERFQISEADADACMSGAFVDLLNSGKRDSELAAEVAGEIAAKAIRPFVTTRYHRTVFQKDTDDRLRLSIDSKLTMTKEFHVPSWAWHTHLGRMYDNTEYYEFPYAVMELKLRDVQMPEWFLAMVRENLVFEVPKFSKFIHSCVAFRKNKVPELPYWIEDFPNEFALMMSSDDTGADGLGVSQGQALGTPIRSPNEDAATSKGCLSCLPNSLRYGRLKDEVPNAQKTGGGRSGKMDPKAFMANERTFLNWNQQAITLGTFGVALLSLGDTGTVVLAGLMMAVIGIMVLAYSQYQYYRRWVLLRDRQSGLQFLDIKGPFVLTICMMVTFALAVMFHVSPPTTGQHIIDKLIRHRED